MIAGSLVSMAVAKLPTPSALPRIAACIRSEVIEHFRNLSEPARLGTIGHRFLANVSALGNRFAAAHQEEPRHRKWLLSIDVERLPAFYPETYAAEVSFAYNVATGTAREIGRGLTREQAAALAGPDEMVGTADVVGLGADRAVVYDYKFGRGFVESASVNWQVLTYALMAARAYGRDAATTGIIRVLGDVTWSEVAEISWELLEHHEIALKALLRKRSEAIALAQAGRLNELPPFTTGPHCTYCPAQRGCPAQVAIFQTQLQRLEQREAGEAKPLAITRENLPALLDAGEQIEGMMKHYWIALENFARANPVPLGGGMVYGEDEHETAPIIAERAEPVFKEFFGEHLGAEIYREALVVKKTLPKEALKAAISSLYIPTLPSKQQRGAKSRVIADLEEKLATAKALDARFSYPVRKHKLEVPKPPKELPEATGEEAA